MLIPPRKLVALPGSFTWPARPVFGTGSLADLLPLRQLAPQARVILGEGGKVHLRVRRDPARGRPEGYTLLIQPGGIELRARTNAGAYYGLQTLRALRADHGARLPACRITDHPDFDRRGVYLDCSRGRVPTLETLKQLVEQLAHWKLNELQLYIENVFTFAAHPQIGRGFSPFSPADILDLQACCRDHHVRLVPSLASFGHFERILALPAYRDLGERPGHLGYPGGTTLCPGDRRGLDLVAGLYAEFLPLFEAVDFNACCDETWELGRGRSLRRARREGTGPVYLSFIRKLHRLCLKHGKRMNIWADIALNHPEILAELPRDLVLLNWDYAAEGLRMRRSREIVDAGLAWVASPGTSGWQSHGTRLRNAMQNVSRFAAEGRRRGAEGLLNTDWGDFGHRNPLGVSLHGFAHGAAHAWNGRAVDDKTFTGRFARALFGPAHAEAARLIRELGKTGERVGDRIPYHAWGESLLGKTDLFRGIPRISPVWLPQPHRKPWIESASPAGCRTVVERLAPSRRTPYRGKPALSPWARAALEDLHLSAGLDAVACRRILLARDLRAGRSVPRRRRAGLRDAMVRLTDAFESNWRRRYRPSRLRDNLRLLRNAAEDMDAS
jgi:hypothetical protein